MTSFVESISPAAKNHVEARLAYFNDLTLAMLQSTRELAELNLEFSRGWLQDSSAAMQKALLASPSERQATDAAPSVEAIRQKMQSYQQQLAQVASNFQNSINQLTQQHVPETARTASELAQAVTEKTVAQADQHLRKQQAAGEEILEKSRQFANVATQNKSMPEPASMQSAGDQGNKS